MIEFVNAKINIGLQIMRKREDGYHDLQTVFYPVGKYAGTPDNPEQFCDILEIRKSKGYGISVSLSGKEIKCNIQDNLVTKAARLIKESVHIDDFGLEIYLDKHLPDGAGMGGGSADASFTLKAINDLLPPYMKLDKKALLALALKLGADCPFFLYNKPMYGHGVGELLEPIKLDLSGLWLVVVKPDVYISTKEAFARVNPAPAYIDLRKLTRDNICEWQQMVRNDFEESIFPSHPELLEIKNQLISDGALYASMSGSGSSIYGIFENKESAQISKGNFAHQATIEGSYLLKL